MFRQLVAFCLLAFTANAFQVCNYNQPSFANKVAPIRALNAPLDVKEAYSGPSFKVGLDETQPIDIAPAEPKEATSIVMADSTEEDLDEPVAAPVGTGKAKWVTAVFWKELDLYGLV